MLKVENLNIKIKKGNKSIVKDISFKLEKGKVLGLLGESGSGKTMICKAIMNLLNYKTFDIWGSILFKEEDLLKVSNRKIKKNIGDEISIIMQNPMTSFNPMSKVKTHIIETIRTHKDVSKEEAYNIGIKELKKMDLKRVDSIMNSYPHMLSGGMIQRVMIALALILEPSLVIADEATTALDVKTQCIVLEEFEKIRDRGISLIVVTHDFKVLRRIAEDILVIKDGEIVERGKTLELFKSPKEDYTEELLKASLLREDRYYA